ncbi:glycosyltransferase [Winogradskyella endarachnes]|uniref:Glycosyltransferase n=1 Tax=Winogradskyella endarachnes TaxID=2681965 RepID=A0A6L6UCF4_9FLAO|nr:glycosyltransferase [Winogradskyella endarachnes]MUU79649.1 glycosyltransferase [Winogradskyella endarachnes]
MGNPVKKKICIVVKSLAGGGAERSAALLSIMLSNLGHEVHVVTVLNDINYKYAGTLLNLGKIKEQNSNWFGGIKRFLLFYNYLRSNNFDFVIDNRTRVRRIREFIISKILYQPSKTIYCMRSFNLVNYMPTNAWLAKFIYGSAFKVIGVSTAITEELRSKFHFTNAITIHNPVDISIEKVSTDLINGDYILFFGRLIDEVKNVSLLLKAYEKSQLHKEKVKLIIMGEGKDKVGFKKKVAAMSCSYFIQFLDFNPNPNSLIANAKFTVLTSHYEGFPRMILESLSLSTPCISVDCKSGPSDIIQHNKNGLLVENYNTDALAEAMNSLYFDKELYNNCKKYAKESVLKYNQENIAKQWQAILN